MNDYVEFGGGLGDAFNTVYTTDLYTRLGRMKEGDRTAVAVISPTPDVCDLFAFHRNVSQLDVKYFQQWPHHEDASRRRQHGLPPSFPHFKERTDPVEFYPSPKDRSILDALPKRFIVLAASAGDHERNLTPPAIDAALVAGQSHGIPVVAIGRTRATRNGRPATVPPHRPGLVNLIDRLTVPGAALVVAASCGVVCCHSGICLLAWHMAKPVFLLYSKMTTGLIADPTLTRGYFFGLQRPETVHGELSRFSAARMSDWVRSRRNAT